MERTDGRKCRARVEGEKGRNDWRDKEGEGEGLRSYESHDGEEDTPLIFVYILRLFYRDPW